MHALLKKSRRVNVECFIVISPLKTQRALGNHHKPWFNTVQQLFSRRIPAASV
jgi:hypothetical protein